MAKSRVRLSALADQDLDAILDRGVLEFGADVTATWLAGFNDVLALLADYPFSGRQRPDLGPDNLRSRAYRSHVLIYQPSDEEVLIVRLLHQRMDTKRHL